MSRLDRGLKRLVRREKEVQIMSLYDLMRTIHMIMRRECKSLNPRFEMGRWGRRVWVDFEGQAYEITVAKVDQVPEHLAQHDL